jgi:hypothetical protein
VLQFPDLELRCEPVSFDVPAAAICDADDFSNTVNESSAAFAEPYKFARPGYPDVSVEYASGLEIK